MKEKLYSHNYIIAFNGKEINKHYGVYYSE